MMTIAKGLDLDADLPPERRLSLEGQRVRLATLTRLRWLSIAGQSAACVFVAWGLWYPYPVWGCFVLIGVSVALNLWLSTRYSKAERLSERRTSLILVFDVVQPTGLLFLTGGIQNPFAVFLVVPAMIAAATQPARVAVGIGVLAVLCATAIAFLHHPIPWPAGHSLQLPFPYLGGMWFALVTTLIFSTFYIYRVAAESRALSDALAATELMLQREQHLSALDGLAAAAAHELGTPLATIALVAKEMRRAAPADATLREDIDLLVSQSDRCRAILGQLASLSSTSEEHLAKMPLSSLIEEAVAPHRDFGVDIRVRVQEAFGPEPVMRRNAGVIYGLGNLIENAVDFASGEVEIGLSWNSGRIAIEICDDGPGYPPDVLKRIGDPYMSVRDAEQRQSGGGLGLGLFIAKTLIERSGARIRFENRSEAEGSGARITVSWPVESFGRLTVERVGEPEREEEPFDLPPQLA
ncbi:ActS/PrrB/RegB family redox-sensitive histidine kinase [Aureimonas sp. Leaf324]|jgi:two-component system sensor histidine kinase RegB|uniref:ActS/PrrB/RegB family redox-sensitive histidine kinase n=1 Tax=Aureimonas sp. Leaf324 TaxID=1736336 RepID=UPI0009E782F8|nr:ActS/PrrB/RegB family redox-sensitive histidine kinase [Aureimonas sp. Leaf324]